MKSRIVKWIILSVVIVIVCILLFSALWPAFHKKAKPGDLLPLSIAPCGNHPKTEQILCVDDNLDALIWRLKIINSAQNTLDFATFSFNDDRSGRDIMSALYDAADRGVKVRMVVDGLSTFLYLHNSKYFNALAQHKNVEVKHYNPINLLKPWRINYRMHDKYIIADGGLYILGGRNTKNLSLGNYEEKKDIDRDIVVYNREPEKGGSVKEVENYFNSIWNIKCTKNYKSKKINEADINNLRAYHLNLKEDFPLAFAPVDWAHETYEVNSVHLLSNPINNGNKIPVLWEHITMLAKQGKDVLIQTPYLMCNKKMYDDLREIAGVGEPAAGVGDRSIGSRTLRVVTNSVENGANICGCADYLNQKKNLLKTGATFYECNTPHSSHAKTILIDDNISIVGSFNYDMRSTYIDTELMLLIDSPGLNNYLRGVNQENMNQGRCVKPDGTITFGNNYQDKQLAKGKKHLYRFLRVATVPVRHLL